jgi:hypothetical protein
MMVRLVSCGVIEHRQARSNRWTNKKERQRDHNETRKEGRKNYSITEHVQGNLPQQKSGVGERRHATSRRVAVSDEVQHQVIPVL